MIFMNAFNLDCLLLFENKSEFNKSEHAMKREVFTIQGYKRYKIRPTC